MVQREHFLFYFFLIAQCLLTSFFIGKKSLKSHSLRRERAWFGCIPNMKPQPSLRTSLDIYWYLERRDKATHLVMTMISLQKAKDWRRVPRGHRETARQPLREEGHVKILLLQQKLLNPRCGVILLLVWPSSLGDASLQYPNFAQTNKNISKRNIWICILLNFII